MIPPKFSLLLVFSLLVGHFGYSQCSTIRQERSITFDTDKDCAPVTVTDFTITYSFSVAQDPADITIRFEWNDPTNSIDEFTDGDAGFVSSDGNTRFRATGTFTYPQNDDCLFEPVSTILVNGEVCETSQQVQTVTSWSPDNNFGGGLAVDPGNFEVCYGKAVTGAVFEDNSTFNCNPDDEPDNPNRLGRFTQFVYGRVHDPATGIRNLTLDSAGTTINLTDATGNLVSTETRGGVTAAFFGPIEELPFPADGPDMTSFVLNAPADDDNQIGHSFQITLYNWNTCNAYNGDADNPNYVDAILDSAYVTIVAPPDPDFQTRVEQAAGAVQDTFCLGQDIYFENLSTNASAYRWEFYDDTTATSLLNTSNAANPVFAFDNPGGKLVRLYADNAAAEGDCEVLYEGRVFLSPAAIAAIGVFESDFSATLNPNFCSPDGTQEFVVGFRDETTNIEAQTQWRWEFYDPNGTLEASIPTGSGFGADTTDFTRTYIDYGAYRARLIARNSLTLCESTAEDTVFVYPQPDSYFEAAEVCAGERTLFTAIPDSVAALPARVNNDYVAVYEWDFSYDSVTFNPELTLTSNEEVAFYLDGNEVVSGTEPSDSRAGTYAVALQMTTEEGMCSAIFVREVTVNPLPEPILETGYSGGVCPDQAILFSNQSDLGTADFQLLITDSASVNDTLVFNQADTSLLFANSTAQSVFYYIWLLGTSPEGCDSLTEAIEVEIFPSFTSNFSDTLYNPTAANCSVWESTLLVDVATQNLNADRYIWTISDENGILDGYPVVKNSDEADFHSLAYAITNPTGTNRRYTVLLEVEKSGNCVSSSTREIVINPEPSGVFAVEVTDECEEKIVRLEANQQGLPSYLWEFDPQPDQVVDEGARQILIYPRPAVGTGDLPLEFTLITQNLANCFSDTVVQSLVVEALEEPLVVDFEVQEDTIMLPDSLIVISNNSSSTAGLSYLWTFGNGETSTVYDPGSVAFNQPGVYIIRLTISNTFCSQSFQRQVVVEPADPVIDFAADATAGCAPLSVRFTNLSQYAESGTFVWDFGDGQSSTLDNPAHTYTRAGTYTVMLSGENRVGRSSEEIKTDYVVVYPQAIASFALNPKTVIVPDQQVFFRNSSQDATSFFWDFGDSTTSEEENPTHTYLEEGNYDITLVATNDEGCSDTLTLFAAVEAVTGGAVRAPNAFSPSALGPGSGGGTGGIGDGVNDVFLPRVEGVTQFRMLIYNKWGQLLFESTSQTEGWDGYYRGRLQPADVYVYKLELTYSDGRRGLKVGDVTLVR